MTRLSGAGVRVMAIAATVLLVAGGGGTPQTTPVAEACGVTVDFTIFTSTDAPEMPGFLEGRLGIIQPTYGNRYHVAAWRVLEGRPLTAKEQQAYLAVSESAPRVDPVQTWLDARSAMPGVAALSETPQQYAMLTGQDMYAYIRNCGDSAFLTAAATLQDRRNRLGDASPVVTDWVRAQDLVFANCARHTDRAPTVPAALDAAAPAQARADRAYQIAAAHFYSGQLTAAEAAFTAIARDPSSPWRAMAPYLAARAMVRQATIGGPKGEGDPAAFARALTAVNAILRDGSRQQVHEPARRLRQFILTRTRPRDVLMSVAADLSSPVHADRFAERLTDLDYLSNRIVVSSDEFTPGAPSDDPLLDWMFTLQSDGDEALAHALGRWDRSHHAAWLVTVLVKLPPDHPRQAELLGVASTVSATSPAYPTLAFHSARLLLRSGRAPDARVVLDQALGMADLPASSVNLFRAARLLTARTLDEFLADAARESVDPGAADRRISRVPYRSVNDVLDRDSLGVINHLPIALVRQAASSSALPPLARRALTLSAFTRVLLTGDLPTAREMLPEVARAAPSLATALAMLNTADDQRLRDEAALLMLHTPGLRPFVPIVNVRDYEAAFHKADGLRTLSAFRDNWWCAMGPPAPDGRTFFTARLHYSGPLVASPQQPLHRDPTSLAMPTFLTAADRHAAADQWRALEQIDAGPNELGRRVLDWARRNPADPRVPEALHRVVRATRLGCTTEATGAVSRAAFTLLHRRYAASPWAARTPHWFK